ncbi:cupin domain-containing protein [Halanaerobium sp. Z-7514]|uniref:Cupin domain-containing protein n=1 Tax=Halanaerobium polyolivorans TaxID=2886943 RepID=A0AAW4WTU3_9FIRM|nr:cupin domain-containing protein [Halanaerobium polyolivorans]MCC3144523.1 cupin domain-containing protein [Halanaerobium polyolivorans]
MEIIKLEELEGKKNKRGVVAKAVLKNDNAQVMNLILSPGDLVPPHQVPVDVFFYIVDGKGTLSIGDDSAVVEAGTVITCPPNTKMKLEADRGEKFEVLKVKTPSL